MTKKITFKRAFAKLEKLICARAHAYATYQELKILYSKGECGQERIASEFEHYKQLGVRIRNGKAYIAAQFPKNKAAVVH